MAFNFLCKGTNSPQIYDPDLKKDNPETTLQSLVLKYWDNEMISNLFLLFLNFGTIKIHGLQLPEFPS